VFVETRTEDKMGSMRSIEMASFVRQGAVSLSDALRDHLQANLFPPQPLRLLPAAERAVELAQQEDWDAEICLPEGIFYRGAHTVSCGEMIRSLRLEVFLDALVDEEEL
jgi:hypothetical protein